MQQIIRVAKLATRSNLIYQPRYTVLQNVSRLKSKPKILEIEIPFIEKDLFLKESSLILSKIEDQFILLKSFEEKVQGAETTYNAKDDAQSLVIDIKEFGQYSFTTIPKERILYFQSPLSGVSKYYYDTENQAWTSNKDKHLLIELLVRETSKYLKGYLNF